MKNFGINEALKSLGIKKSNPGVSTGSKWYRSSGAVINSYSPVDGKLIGKVKAADEKSVEKVVAVSHEAFMEWRKWPAPRPS